MFLFYTLYCCLDSKPTVNSRTYRHLNDLGKEDLEDNFHQVSFFSCFLLAITHFNQSIACFLRPGGGGGVLPYMGYIGTCRGIGCGF